MQQLGTAGDDEAKPRNTLDALVGTADEEVYAQFVYIEGNTAEAAHGVYNQFLAVHLDEVGYLLEGIEHAGSGFAMHHGNVSDFGIVRKIVVDVADGDLLCFVKSKHVVRDAVILGDVAHAVAVGAVAQYEKFVARLDDATDDGFHTVRAAALQEDGSIVSGMLGGEGDEGLTDFFHNVEVVVFVPSTPVGQHGFLDGL